jgi:hypothetical protein
MKAKLSPSQRLLLTNVRDGEDPYTGVHGRSQHGGFARTIRWAFKGGYVREYDGEWAITDAGLELLKANVR